MTFYSDQFGVILSKAILFYLCAIVVIFQKRIFLAPLPPCIRNSTPQNSRSLVPRRAASRQAKEGKAVILKLAAATPVEQKGGGKGKAKGKLGGKGPKGKFWKGMGKKKE